MSTPRTPVPEMEAEVENLGPVGLAAFNAVFWPYLLTTSAIAFVPAMGLYALSMFDKKRTLLRRFTEEWGAHYLERAPFAGVTVIGREKIDPERPVVYVANHSSMVDVLAIYSARVPGLWVSKVENFYAPFIGWNMYLNGYVAVRRGYLPSIMKMVRVCLAKLAKGQSLIVFPEGTRTEDGNLKSFYRGAFVLAARAKVPIVPIILDGTRGVLKKGSFSVHPRHVTVKILDSIDPRVVGYDSKRLRDMVRAVMAHELRTLRGARPPSDLPPSEQPPSELPPAERGAEELEAP